MCVRENGCARGRVCECESLFALNRVPAREREREREWCLDEIVNKESESVDFVLSLVFYFGRIHVNKKIDLTYLHFDLKIESPLSPYGTVPLNPRVVYMTLFSWRAG